MIVPLTSCFLAHSFLVPTSPPLNITGEKQNSTRITLSWEAVPIQHQRGEIINYVVKVVKSDGGNVTQYNATTLGLDIGGLEKFTFYKITVSASTSKGTSNASSVFQIRTAEDGKPIVIIVLSNKYEESKFGVALALFDS